MSYLEFLMFYAEHHHWSLDFLVGWMNGANNVAHPCDCGDPTCRGWAMSDAGVAQQAFDELFCD